MMKLPKPLVKFYHILMTPADDCCLFPIVARIGVYGLLLMIIIWIQDKYFAPSDLAVVTEFMTLLIFVESLWRKVEVGKRMYWHFISLSCLVIFLGITLRLAVLARDEYHRTHLIEENIGTLIQESPHAVVICDGHGTIKNINKEASFILGWKPNEVIGKNITIFIRPHNRLKHHLAFQETILLLPPGSTQWIHLNKRFFTMVDKQGEELMVSLSIVGVRFAPKNHNTRTHYPVYPDDYEFYAIIEPYDYDNFDGYGS